MVESAVPFPRASSADLSRINHGDERSAWNRASAIDVHRTLYSPLGTEETIVEQTTRAKASIEKLYEMDAVYENPLITATSRSIISNIHVLLQHLLQVDAPSPKSVFAYLLIGAHADNAPPLFHISKAWSEIVDISESEGFDRSRKIHLEHMVHLLFLPGLHTSTVDDPSSDTLDLVSAPSHPPTAHYGYYSSHASHHPRLKVLGVKLPTPFHISLRVLSRLSFNEAGKITHHRDMWDVKDLARAVIPGARLALWLSSRLGGHGLAAASRCLMWAMGGSSNEAGRYNSQLEDEKRLLEGTGTHSSEGSDRATTDEDGGRNALGLMGVRESSSSNSGDHSATRYPTDSYEHSHDSMNSTTFRRSSYGTSVDMP